MKPTGTHKWDTDMIRSALFQGHSVGRRRQRLKVRVAAGDDLGQDGGQEGGRGSRDQIANICWITEKTREFQKKIYI